jgi:peptide/nickel transport system substrate-binding protein
MLRFALPLLLLAGCSSEPPGGTLAVAVAGEGPDAVALAEQLAAEASEATLISRGPGGELAPGLATSWRFLDSGSDLILRLAPVRWPANGGQGPELAARDVVLSLGRTPRHYRPALAATGLAGRGTARAPIARVVELSPRPATPHLLDWLAEPALAVRDRRGRPFPGPYAARRDGNGWQLERRSEMAQPAARAARISLSLLPADGAIREFAAGRRALVLGTGLAGLGAVRASDQGRDIRIEAVDGVIGLAMRSGGALGDARLRRALWLAADGGPLANRVALAALVPQSRLWSQLPPAADDRSRPLTDRRAEARALLAEAGYGPDRPLRLRLAVPAGPDWLQLAEALANHLVPIGINLTVAPADRADLLLEEHVANVPDAVVHLARWSCARARPCSPEADQLLAEAAAVGNNPVRRLALAAAAETEMQADPAFVPLLRPVRWALVAERLTGFQPNRLGRHPLGRISAE